MSVVCCEHKAHIWIAEAADLHCSTRRRSESHGAGVRLTTSLARLGELIVRGGCPRHEGRLKPRELC